MFCRVVTLTPPESTSLETSSAKASQESGHSAIKTGTQSVPAQFPVKVSARVAGKVSGNLFSGPWSLNPEAQQIPGMKASASI